MRFNGVDPCTIHECISINKEIYPTIPTREVATVDTARGAMVANVSLQQDEAIIRINIAAKTNREAEEARIKLAEWAASSRGRTAELEPTNKPGKAYQAILSKCGRIEHRFTTVDVVFLLPRPVLHSIVENTARGSGAEMTFVTGGTAETQPIFLHTLSQNAEGLQMVVDGITFFAIDGTINAGQTVKYDLKTGETLIDGRHAENRILYAQINPDIELMPGPHRLEASVAGNMTVRWHDEWL